MQKTAGGKKVDSGGCTVAMDRRPRSRACWPCRCGPVRRGIPGAAQPVLGQGHGAAGPGTVPLPLGQRCERGGVPGELHEHWRIPSGPRPAPVAGHVTRTCETPGSPLEGGHGQRRTGPAAADRPAGRTTSSRRSSPGRPHREYRDFAGGHRTFTSTRTTGTHWPPKRLAASPDHVLGWLRSHGLWPGPAVTPGGYARWGYGHGRGASLFSAPAARRGLPPRGRRSGSGAASPTGRPRRSATAGRTSPPGDDTLIAAPTGSGKTLAGFLVCIDRLYRAHEAGEPSRRDVTRVVYVSPLKALAVDIAENLERPLAEIAAVAAELGPRRARHRASRSAPATPPAPQRAAMLRQPPSFVVTTPESLYLLVTSAQRPRARCAPSRR